MKLPFESKESGARSECEDEMTEESDYRTVLAGRSDGTRRLNELTTLRTGSGVRLVIQKIDNINFKSYAGKQTLGPFHKSLASIVGPNGCGKSKEAQSVMFVFGSDDQKPYSKQLSFLIHKSAAHKDLDFCRVNVHLALINVKPFEVVEDSQFVVSRVANKDNSSYYLINDRRVQFKVVSSLLQRHGIDLRSNRFFKTFSGSTNDYVDHLQRTQVHPRCTRSLTPPTPKSMDVPPPPLPGLMPGLLPEPIPNGASQASTNSAQMGSPPSSVGSIASNESGEHQVVVPGNIRSCGCPENMGLILEGLKESIDKLTTTVNGLHKKVDSLSAELKNLNTQVKSLTSDVTVLKVEVGNLQTNVGVINDTLSGQGHIIPSSSSHQSKSLKRKRDDCSDDCSDSD